MKNKKSKPKIIFIGTPEYGAIVLDKLIKGGYPPILVITASDKPAGRKQIITSPPVKFIAQKYKIPTLQPEKIEKEGARRRREGGGSGAVKSEIENLKPDLAIVAAYSQIIPKDILAIPKFGFLNVHPSLLPRWRGPSPIQFTILNGDEKTGVTIIKITEKVDAGPIIAQKEIVLEGKETYIELHNNLGELGGNLLIKTIPKFIRGEIKPESQEEAGANYSKIIKKEDGKIDWNKSAVDIERQIRAFSSWPGTFILWGDKRIKILKARAMERINTVDYPIGKTLVAPQNELCVQTGEGFLIIEKLQMEGKKELNSEEFLRGYPNFIGIVLK
jgi:methionyl-tRNA formyltransferase